MPRTSPTASASCSIGCTCSAPCRTSRSPMRARTASPGSRSNRPERLNSFTRQMHGEVRDALAIVARRSRRARAGAHRRGPRVLRGPGPRRPCGCARRRAGRPRRIDRAALHSARHRIARAADARAVRRQRCRGGGGCQHRAGLRHRRRRALGKLHPGVLPDRPRARFGRHVVPAAARRAVREPRAWRCSATSCRRSRPRRGG